MPKGRYRQGEQPYLSGNPSVVNSMTGQNLSQDQELSQAQVEPAINTPQSGEISSPKPEISRFIPYPNTSNDIPPVSAKIDQEIHYQASLVDYLPDAVISTDIHGIIKSWNQAATRIFGWSREEALEKELIHLLKIRVPPKVNWELPQCSANNSESQIENHMCHKDGRGIDVISKISFLKDKNGNLIGRVEIFRKITEENQFAEALKKIRDELAIQVAERNAELQQRSEELGLRSRIIEMVGSAILISNSNHELLYANDAASRLYGYTPEEFKHLKVQNLVPAVYWPEFESDKKILQAEGQIIKDTYHQRKNGSIFPVNVQTRVLEIGQSRYILSNIHDETQRKNTEERLKKDELRYQSILNAVTEGVALISPDGIILHCNKAEAKILGLDSPNKRIGKHFADPAFRTIYPDGSPVPIEETSVATAFRRKRSIRNFEMGVVKEDGSTIWLNINAIPIIDDSGQVISVVRTMTDITQQKKFKDEQEQFTRRLLEVQEEERKRISRELHDDTAQYIALLILEMDALIEKEKQLPLEIISRIQKLRDTAEKTLQEVRRFSHELRPSVLEHLGLTAALELIIEEFNSTCKTRTRLNIQGEEQRLSDEAELAFFRIAQEALSNIRRHAEASEAVVTLQFGQQQVLLTVADNGKGFTLKRKNQPFTKRSLGLIGMRERARLINANLKISSRINKGTVVSLEFPVNYDTPDGR